MLKKESNPGKRKNISAPHTAKKKATHEFETMSQRQNRYGKGRERNGSDGFDQVRGSNH